LFGCSRIRYDLLTFPAKQSRVHTPKLEITTKLLGMKKVAAQQWNELRKLQGYFAVSYLKWRYGSHDTYVLLAYVDIGLVHVEWVIPAYKLKSRYPFLPGNSYSVISCLTLKDFRGLGIYPSQIQKVMESNIGTGQFYMWAASDNIASLRGILKAGGIKVGEFVRKKWFWGLISQIECSVEGNDCA